MFLCIVISDVSDGVWRRIDPNQGTGERKWFGAAGRGVVKS